MFGAAAFAAAITDNCRQAARMAAQVEARDGFALMHPVVSNICVFTAAAEETPERQSQINTQIAMALQLTGSAVFSTTDVAGTTCLRAAITNHRTRDEDITAALDAVQEMRLRV